jgi:hypothetical protein
MTTTKTPTTRRRPAGRRRGSIYAIVLGMAILVSLIGLSTVAVGRINLRATAASGEGADAEVLALSAVEQGASVINSDPSWRTKYNDVPSAPRTLGRGMLYWKVVDESDASLASGGLQPARVYGYGVCGESRRAFSVQLAPGGTNRATNGGIEQGAAGYAVQGGDCVIDAATDAPHDGGRYLRVRSRLNKSAGPQQDLTPVIATGKSYYVEMWVKMTASAEAPTVSIIAKGSGLLGLPIGQTEATYQATAQQAGLEWTRVYVTLNPNWSGTATTVVLRVETSTTNQDFKIDDLKLIEGALTTPMVPARDSWRQESLP